MTTSIDIVRGRFGTDSRRAKAFKVFRWGLAAFARVIWLTTTSINAIRFTVTSTNTCSSTTSRCSSSTTSYTKCSRTMPAADRWCVSELRLVFVSRVVGPLALCERSKSLSAPHIAFRRKRSSIESIRPRTINTPFPAPRELGHSVLNGHPLATNDDENAITRNGTSNTLSSST